MLKKTMARFSSLVPACALAVLVFMAGCAQHAVAPSIVMPEAPEQDRSVLAGEWEYEEGGVVTLRLDEQGNGSYTWKDGRFETTRLDDHLWVGKWIQRENDREGWFQIQLSPDYTEGEGIWWYARIGDNRAPAQRGGTFHLTKKTSLTNLNDTPAAP